MSKKTALLGAVLVLTVALSGCQRTPGQVVNKVLTDFGVRKAPEEQTEVDSARLQKLAVVGEQELARLNQESRRGDVKCDTSDKMRALYYKEAKVYENFYPVDYTDVMSQDEEKRGFQGYIDFEYRMYQSERFPTRAEAAMANATVPSDQGGRERYRYSFTQGGEWNGRKGVRAKD